MPEKRIEKPMEEEGKKLSLVTNEKFAKFLVKEFPEEFGRQPGKAMEIAFRYPREKKEVAMLLKEWMPKASFKSIDWIFENMSSDTISKKLQILEEHEIPPSTWLLVTATARLEENIHALKDRGRNGAGYARLSDLAEEPKKFNELLNREDAIIKKLKEKLPNVSSDAIKKLVNETGLTVLEKIVRDVERQEGKLEEFTDSNIQILVLSSKRHEPTGLSMSLPPEKPNLKLLMGGPYCLADRETFEYLINKRFEGVRKGVQVGLHEPEREAFKEMEWVIDRKGKINSDEVQSVYNKHVGYSHLARNRLDEILSWLTEHGGWKKWGKTEKNEQADRMDRQAVVKVHGRRRVYLPQDIVSAMRLKDNTPCKFECKESTFTATTLDQPTFSAKISAVTKGESGMVISEYMLRASGLKPGDYIEWNAGEWNVSLRKVEEAGESRTRIRYITRQYVGITIPTVLVEELKLKRGMYVLGTFDSNKIWLEFKNENPYIGVINKEGDYSWFDMPRGMRGWLRDVDEVLMEVRDGKFYMRKKQ